MCHAHNTLLCHISVLACLSRHQRFKSHTSLVCTTKQLSVSHVVPADERARLTPVMSRMLCWPLNVGAVHQATLLLTAAPQLQHPSEPVQILQLLRQQPWCATHNLHFVDNVIDIHLPKSSEIGVEAAYAASHPTFDVACASVTSPEPAYAATDPLLNLLSGMFAKL